MKALLLGAGGHARVVAEAAAAAGIVPSAYTALEDAPWLDLPRLDDAAALADPSFDAIIPGIGGVTPEALARRLVLIRRFLDAGKAAPAIVHPGAIVSPDARLAAGAAVMAGAAINPGAAVGTGAIVNTRAVVEHDASVGAGSHVAPGAIVLGGARLGESCMIGAGAVVLPGAQVPGGTLVKALARFPAGRAE